MSPSTVTYTTAFIVACGFLMLAPSLAAPPPPPPTIPLPPLFGKDPDVQKCLATIQTIHGCLEEIITSFLSLQFQLIGPVCCKTFLEIEDKCLPKIFPFGPFFVPLLKKQCTTVVAQAEQPAPSSTAVTVGRKVIGNPKN
ncbi:hypothetical protein CRYUN_Cryun26dG0087200 [Craigia yunnanensis]